MYRHRALSARQVVSNLRLAVRAFMQNMPQHDDVIDVSIKREVAARVDCEP